MLRGRMIAEEVMYALRNFSDDIRNGVYQAQNLANPRDDQHDRAQELRQRAPYLSPQMVATWMPKRVLPPLAEPTQLLRDVEDHPLQRRDVLSERGEPLADDRARRYDGGVVREAAVTAPCVRAVLERRLHVAAEIEVAPDQPGREGDAGCGLVLHSR